MLSLCIYAMEYTKHFSSSVAEKCVGGVTGSIAVVGKAIVGKAIAGKNIEAPFAIQSVHQFLGMFPALGHRKYMILAADTTIAADAGGAGRLVDSINCCWHEKDLSVVLVFFAFPGRGCLHSGKCGQMYLV